MSLPRITAPLSFLQLVSLLLLAGIETYAGPAPTDIFIAMGQSNMKGGRKAYGDDTLPLERVYLLDDQGNWEVARNPLAKYNNQGLPWPEKATNIGPSYQFGKDLATAFPDRQFGLIVMAVGGKRIEFFSRGDYERATDGGAYYNLVHERLQMALQNTPGARLRGIIWHQGEDNAAGWEGYLPLLRQLINAWREDTGIPDLFWCVGELGQWREPSHNWTYMNQVLNSVPDSIPYTDCVSSDGCTNYKGLHRDDSSRTDVWHFDQNGAKLLGVRYAEKVIEHVYGDLVEVQRRDFRLTSDYRTRVIEQEKQGSIIVRLDGRIVQQVPYSTLPTTRVIRIPLNSRSNASRHLLKR